MYERNFRFDNGDHLYIGEDKPIDFTIYTDDTRTVVEDVTGMDLDFVVTRSDRSAEALIEKSTAASPGGIATSGTFNADPAQNTQVVRVLLEREDSYDLAVSPDVNLIPDIYRYALRRADTGANTVFAHGDLEFRRSPAP